MSKRLKVFGGLLVAVASVMAMGANGCAGTPLHKAEVSAGAIAASLHTAASTNHSNTLETADERKMVAGYIVEAAAANDNFLGLLKSAETNGGKPDAAAITAAFDGLVNRVNDLQVQGVLQIKSQQAQANFALVISSIQAELATLKSLYPSLNARNGNRWVGGIASAAVFTGAEIEELIALAITAGSELVPKLVALRGKSGAEIISDAEADDLAAETIAEEDGAEEPSTDESKPKQ